MKTLVSLAAIALTLAGCATSGPAAYVEPIPGSITYKGQPRTKLTKSPIGSTFSHEFRIDGSTRAVETYRIAPDRSLELIDRRIIRDWLFGRDD
ncbi:MULTISPECIES: hypothetical protein [Rhizobium/Agrobacterium group]|jgi:PBP1b-binding outer membrane lipoprotein LpoB|uniref:hypothetical protein n=1 Tax=Rhizobium/Agrobacterium group TaxID=227290 RepID=UPI00047035A3|nr:MULTISPECIES: hypothetical protein [Rhizobium/Agrobacterium group]HCV71080.1 hypothetical protein [Agrobacterium sp.]KAA3529107.1 hypothetical protein DXM29_09980 [Agrobacterium tumefaciens]KQY41692.1 hypothetical protein ASD46_15335 [Rhizobium sp. Root491]MDR5010570.1 hypothetical protein [Agrobacterium tumefaciens]NSY58721.1 hypothetical protein [Agrobacterium tumefaciens]